MDVLSTIILVPEFSPMNNFYEEIAPASTILYD